MDMTNWQEREKKCTVLITFDIDDGGSFLVSKQVYNNEVWDTQAIIDALKAQEAKPPVYRPSPIDVDPFFIEAHGYCRLVFSVDPARVDWLFDPDGPFDIKQGPQKEFCVPEIITREQMGKTGNPDGAYAFYVDDYNTKKDDQVILYNLNMLFSQDGSEAKAFATKVQIDPTLKNENDG